jgi:hypothetical protein
MAIAFERVWNNQPIMASFAALVFSSRVFAF